MDIALVKMGLKVEHFSLLQMFVDELLEKADVDKLEHWAFTGKCEQKYLNKYVKILETMEPPLVKMDINPNIVSIIFIQYLMADNLEREIYKKQWVKRVYYRENGADWFPTAGQIIKTLLANNHLLRSKVFIG